MPSGTYQKIAAKVASVPKTLTQKSRNHIVPKDLVVRGVAGDVAFFLLKVAALETTRRFSRAKCPFAWRSIQAFQMLCYPPFKWVHRWAPLKGLVRGMQVSTCAAVRFSQVVLLFGLEQMVHILECLAPALYSLDHVDLFSFPF